VAIPTGIVPSACTVSISPVPAYFYGIDAHVRQLRIRGEVAEERDAALVSAGSDERQVRDRVTGGVVDGDTGTLAWGNRGASRSVRGNGDWRGRRSGVARIEC